MLAMESLNAVMEQLRSAMEGQAVEAEKSLTRIKEKIDYMEKLLISKCLKNLFLNLMKKKIFIL